MSRKPTRYSALAVVFGPLRLKSLLLGRTRDRAPLDFGDMAGLLPASATLM